MTWVPYIGYGTPEVRVASLTDRLEVRVPRESMRLVRDEADRRGVSMGELVRQAISLLLDQDRQAPMEAARDLFLIEAPVYPIGPR